MSHDRIRALVALACDQHTTEEGRTAAVRACQLIKEAGILGEPSLSAPNPFDVDLHDIDSVKDWLRKDAEHRAAWAAIHGSDTARVRWPSRTFCFRCKRMIEEKEESVQHTFTTTQGRFGSKFECLHCFDKIDATKLSPPKEGK